MAQSFRMTRDQVVSSDAATLKSAILAAAGSESGTESIMRSLQRMGDDPSVEYFEMIEVVGRRMHGGAAPAGWRVRADRGRTEETGL